MSELLEVPIDDWLASFDGRVLEIHTPYQSGSMLTVQFRRSEKGLWPFDEDQRAGVEALVQAVNAARGV